MVARGGASTIYGVLYQILVTLDRALTLSVNFGPVSDGEPDGACLRIEPEGGGGDLQIVFPSERVVEQCKAKSDQGTWSLQVVIDEILPDLYLAVDATKPDENITFRVVTEGRLGDWLAAYEFFRRLPKQPPSQPLEALDDTKRVRFARSQTLSELELFRKVAEDLRAQRESIEKEPLETTYQKLWRLLSRFEFEQLVAPDILVARIDSILLLSVSSVAESEEKRRQLCGRLLEWGMQSKTVTPAELLSQVGLDTVRLTDALEIRRRTDELLARSFAFCGYDDASNVRSAIPWDAGKHLIVVGSSGVGKTWAVCSIAREAANEGDIVVALTSEGSAAQTWEKALARVWQEILGRTSLPPFSRIAQLTQQAKSTPRVTLLIDEVGDPTEAMRLLERATHDSGVRLALIVPKTLAAAIKRQHGNLIQVSEVPPFSANELATFLEARGYDWAAVRSDIRETLRLPILGSLYCQLGVDQVSTSTTEYELYAEFWSRIGNLRQGPLLLNAANRLAAIASTILEDGSAYPWSQAAVSAAGINEPTQLHLEGVGWLLRDTQGASRIAHDRFLNWAVAEGLFAKYEVKSLSIEQICEMVTRTEMPGARFAGRSMANVGMDLVWLMSSAGHPSEAAKVIGAIGHWHVRYLYSERLPTLGSTVIDALLEMIRNRKDPATFPTPLYIADAIVAIGERERGPVERIACTLLADQSPDLQEVAMRVLGKFPIGTVLDRLWALDQANEQQRKQAKGDNDALARCWFRRGVILAALGECAEISPQWLKRKLESTQGAEQLSELAFILSGLTPSVGAAIWQESRAKLIDAIGAGPSISLVGCIEQFSDLDQVAYLKRLIRADSFDSAWALCALVRLDSKTAVQSLGEAFSNGLVATASRWLPDLILADRASTQAALLQVLGSSPPDSCFAGYVYSAWPNAMDATSVDYLLDRLSDLLAEPNIQTGNSSTGQREIPPMVHHLLRILGYAWHPLVLPRFAAHAGDVLDERLAGFAIEVVRPGRAYNHNLEDIRRILFKIDGPGLTKLVNFELSRPDYLTRKDGLDWCLAKPDEETRRLLWQLSRDPACIADNDQNCLRQVALQGLVKLGEGESVAEFILEVGDCYSRDLVWSMRDSNCVTERILAAAVTCLDDKMEDKRRSAACIIAASGRGELAALLRGRMGSPTQFDVSFIIEVLRILGAKDSETVAWLAAQLSTLDNRTEALGRLLEIGTSDALTAVQGALHAAVSSGFTQVDQWAALDLWRHASHANATARLIWENLQRSDAPKGDDIEAVADLDDPRVRDWLFECVSSAPSSRVPFSARLAAIRALAKVDPEAALAACRAMWGEDPTDAASVGAVMLEIDPSQVEHILDQLPTLKPSIRDHIGRILRGIDDKQRLAAAVRTLLTTSSSTSRRCAAEVARWLGDIVPDQTLREMAASDPDRGTRQVALNTLIAREAEQIARSLIEQAEMGDVVLTPLLASSIVENADPYLLKTPGDALFLGDRLDGIAREHLRRRKCEIEKAAEERDRQEQSAL